jgi:sugar transferase (PEP-CTERM/EpsH1 system associated)
MKILVLSPIVPDAPSDGDRLRIHYFMRELSRRHELVLACFSDPARPSDNDLGALKGITSEIHRVPMPRSMQWLNAGMRGWGQSPANVSAYASREMRALVDGLLTYVEFDGVLCYRLRMAPYAMRARLPRLLDYTDSLTRYMERRAVQASGLKRWIWGREAAKLAAYEQFCAWQFKACLMNSENDAETLRAMAPGSNVVTVSNGVDFSHLKPGKFMRDPDRLVFVGNLAYPPNVEAVRWFVQDIFPMIRAERPKARFSIVGGHAPASLASLGQRPGVEFKGFAADFRPLLWDAAVSVCPVRLAAGRQNKILDAFACQTPVVATSLTASGCEAKDGKELLTADTAEEFAAKTLRLMARPALGKALASRAYSFVKRHYAWGRSAHLIESAFKGAW